MATSRKLQVFVSSTYTDLREERQTAVEAILAAGHLPAGMELFAAGDESQMTVIRRWIDESDVFLLILGGRYGSVEPVSGKSYTHLEFEYAVAQGKPSFAVVITDEALDRKVKQFGRAALETENGRGLDEFRRFVLGTRIVKFFDDPRDIKVAIYEALADFSRRTELVGWIPGDQAVNTSLLAEEIARLTKENSDLRSRIIEAGASQVLYTGLSFEELLALLEREPVYPHRLSGSEHEDLERAVAELGSQNPSLLHVFWMLRNAYDPRAEVIEDDVIFTYLGALGRFGLVTFEPRGSINDRRRWRYGLTDDGRKFLVRLQQFQLHRPPTEEEEISSDL